MTDSDLIASLGGPARVAQLLGYSLQRVSNWRARGIPPAEKVLRPDLFLPHLARQQVPNEPARAAA